MAQPLVWKTLFDNMNSNDKSHGKKSEKSSAKGDEPIDIPDIDDVLAKSKEGGKKKLSVERIYQKKTQLEHILLRPDTYIGSVEKATQPMWVYDNDEEMMMQRDITFVPGLYKIFDEILVNAADNKQRDPNMTCVKIDIDPENNKIKIWNNGKGIPVIEHKTEKMYVPTLIFGHLLTSSNYDDTERKVTGGRNGYGAKLCNIFSTKFIVETQANDYGKAFRQQWQNNMGKAGEPKIVPSKGDDYTCITFHPDLSKFGMETLDKDIVDLFSRRAYDVAASTRGVKVFLNGKKLPVKGFKDYVELYLKNKVDDLGNPLKCVYEVVNDRWEVALTLSEKGFQQVSFVNSIATTKGGKHTDYVCDQIVNKIIEAVKKKEGAKSKGAVVIKPFQVKNHLWVFVNCLIENPTFDSQTKENMTLLSKKFGSKCELSENFFKNATKCGIVESVLSWMKFKAQEKMNKKCGNVKQSKLKGIPKLDDANDAGTKNSTHCTLILTEGDSAKSLAVAGLGVVGRDHYGVFPLRGKLLNVREASAKQIMENAEINNLIKILGLRYKEKYDSPEALKTLRYGKMMIMTDQDQDGSHIKGLLINFIHHNWPNLLRTRFVEEFITPIVKVTKGKEEHAFYSIPEFEEWKKETANWHTYRVKYYKGLGTSTSKEAKEYFTDMERHRIPFRYGGADDDACIELAFSKKKIEERKTWLTNWMEERKRRALLGLPELYLYGKEMKTISYNEFVNRELILFSNMDNERSIPSLVDGLKPGQRKVMFTCFKRNLTKEMKVAQLAGSVAEHSAYHHGENSLMATIINLAQNFVGSNNINLLQPRGQFGTRLHGGKDAASPRYIFTCLSPLARLLFTQTDDPLLKYMYDDNQRIEPEFYVPIIPMVLVNGADGIGTGWSTRIPNYDPREIVRNIKKMIDGLDPVPMTPCFKNFTGTVEQIDEQRYVVSGEVAVVDDQTIEITELPVRTWTQVYKENVLEPMLQGTDKTPAMITDFKEYHTDTTVRYVIKMTPEKLRQAEMTGLHKVFKLQTTLSTGSMVLFDSNGCIKRYTQVEEILKEFYETRMEFYRRRKDYLEGMLAAESLKLDNQARFIMEKIEDKIKIENVPKKELVQVLVRRGYDSDPVKTWKEAQDKLAALKDEAVDNEEEDETSSTSSSSSGPDFNYILSMPLWSLTKEKKDELLKNRDQKADELYELRKKSPHDLYQDDLSKFLKELDAVEAQEKEDEEAGVTKTMKTAKGRQSKKKLHLEETKPSPMGRRVEPRIDPALRAKAEAAAVRKKKAEAKKEAGLLNLDDESIGGDSEEPKPLMERLNQALSPTAEAMKSGAGQTKGAAKKRAPKKEAASKKEALLMSKFLSGIKQTKKKKAKDPFADSDEDNIIVSDSDDEAAFNDSYSPPPRLRESRATAKPAKYTFSDNEGSDEEGPDLEPPEDISDEEFNPTRNDASDDDFFPTKKKKSPKKTNPQKKTKKETPPVFPSDEEEDMESSPPATNSQDSSLPETSNGPVSIESDSGDDLPITSAVPPPKKKTLGKKATITTTKPKKEKAPKKPKAEGGAPKKRAAPKKTKSPFDSDQDDDDIFGGRKKKAKKSGSDDEDFMIPQAKSKKPSKKKPKASSEEEMEEVDFSAMAGRERRARGAAPTKYKFSDSSEDDDEDF